MAKKNENQYFSMMVEMGDCSLSAAQRLREVLTGFDVAHLPEHIQSLHAIEHAGDELKHEMSKKLAREFITPIDREDIMDISGEIDDVTDAIEDVLLKIHMFDIRTIRPEAIEFCTIIANGCEELVKLLKEFHNFRKSPTIHASIVEVNRLEEEGDALYVKGVHDLYAQRGDAVEIIAWTEVFGCLEKCCDTCEHVANLVENVIMKNT